MKKKIAMLFLLVFTLVLASCGSSNSREKQIIENYSVKTTLSDLMVNKYKLGFANIDTAATDAKTLGNTSAENADDYYIVYVAKDTEASLFKYSYNADKELQKHIFDGNRNKNKTFQANTLYFKEILDMGETYCKDQVKDANKQETEIPYYKQTMIDIFLSNKVLTILYGTDSVLKDLSFTNYKFTQDTTSSFTKAKESNYAGDALIDGKSNITFDVVYLPLFVVRKTSSTTLSSMIMLPIYTTFSVDGKEISSENNKYKLVDSTIATMNTLQVVLDPDYGSIIG